MRVRARTVLTIAAAIVTSVVVGFFLTFYTALGSPGWQLIGRAIGDTPEARVATYLEAVGRGDAQKAFDTWLLWPRHARLEQIAARRERVTRDLAARRPQATVERFQWWRTCCEPGVIDSRASAGGA